MKSKLTIIQERHQNERRHALLDTAAHVIAKNGLRQTTMDDISASLGMTKIVFYRTFESRSHLIKSILERVTNRLLEEDAIEDPWWGDRIFRTMEIARENEDSMIILLHQTSHDREYDQYYKKFYKTLVNRTQQRLAERWGGVGKHPVDLTFCSETIVTFILDSIARWLKNNDNAQDKEFVEWINISIKAMSDKWAED